MALLTTLVPALTLLTVKLVVVRKLLVEQVQQLGKPLAVMVLSDEVAMEPFLAVTELVLVVAVVGTVEPVPRIIQVIALALVVADRLTSPATLAASASLV